MATASEIIIGILVVMIIFFVGSLIVRYRYQMPPDSTRHDTRIIRKKRDAAKLYVALTAAATAALLQILFSIF